jgi:hypothetical protein
MPTVATKVETALADAADASDWKTSDWLALLKVDRRTFRRLKASGRVPQPDYHLSERRLRWYASTVKRWHEAQAK